MDSQTAPSPVAIPIQRPPKRFSLLLALLSLLVLLLLLSTAFLAYQNMQLQKQIMTLQIVPSPTPTASADPTVNWKTYTDSGFSLKYPSEMNIKTSSTPNISYLETSDFQASGASGYQIQITKITSSIQTTDQFMQVAPNTPEQTFLDKQNVTTINGNQAVVRTYQGGWSVYKKYYVYSPKLAVILQGTGKDHTTFDQILSTFKFTEMGTPTSQLGCTNKELGVQLTLPNKTWQCDSKEDPGAGLLTVTSPIFTIAISNGGRGPYCGDDGGPNCVITPFYSNEAIKLNLYIQKNIGGEIFGSIPDTKIKSSPWVSIKYQGIEKQSLTAAQKSELIQLIDSIQKTN